MNLPVTLERDESGMIVAECPAIPGCVSQGQTEEEALANIREAIVAASRFGPPTTTTPATRTSAFQERSRSEGDSGSPRVSRFFTAPGKVDHSR